MKKRAIIALAAVALLAAAAFALLFPRSCDVDISGEMLEWQNESDYTGSREFTINGVYRRSVLSGEAFSGTMSIEGINATDEYPELILSFTDKHYAIIQCVSFENGSFEGKIIGSIVCSSDFSEFSIILGGDFGEWSSESTRVLSYPARSREQAVALTAELCEENWLCDAHWR